MPWYCLILCLHRASTALQLPSFCTGLALRLHLLFPCEATSLNALHSETLGVLDFLCMVRTRPDPLLHPEPALRLLYFMRRARHLLNKC